MDHVAPRELKGLLAGRLGKGERNRVVRHLLSGCGECLARLAPGVLPQPPGPAGSGEEVYDRALDRAEKALPQLTVHWEKEQERRGRRLALLPAADRKPARGQRVSQVEVLLELSFALRYTDPARMRELALAAQSAADKLRPSKAFPMSLLWDLRARVAAEVANAHRVNEKWFDHEMAIEQAHRLLDRGTGDLLIKARIHEVEATGWLAAGASPALAERFFNRALRLYRRFGERHLIGRALVHKGICRRLDGHAFDAVGVLREALSLLTDCQDRQLLASARQCFMDAVVDSGDLDEAEKLLRRRGLRKEYENEPLGLLWLRWVEGKLFAGRGRLGDAERVLREVRDGFSACDREFTSVIAGLDLAKVLLAQGKLTELHALSQALTFQAAANLPPAAREALVTFEILCGHRKALTIYAERVQTFLRRLERNRRLAWRAEAISG